MRRALVTMLAVPALLLSACGSDDEQSAEESSSQQEGESQQTSEGPTESAQATQEPTDAQQSTEEPSDAAESTAGKPEGGAAGKAAAARTKEFMVALVNADPNICQLIMNFEGGEPMKDSPQDLKVCKEVLPSTLEGVVSPEEADVIDVIEVNGADVKGDTATVDSDNFADVFAQGFGDQEIKLKKVKNEWYVDLDNSFQGTTG
ncbi:MAG: hypothetical protein WA892_11235 [Ornithinimicrobium sp.]